MFNGNAILGDAKLILTSRAQEALAISHLGVLGFQLSVRVDEVLC